MVADVSLMVTRLVTGDEAVLPQFLIYQNGVWRDVPSSGPAITLKKIRDNIDQRISETMGRVGSLGAGPAPPLLMPLSAVFRTLYKSIVPSDVQKVLMQAAETTAGGEVPILRIHIHPQVEWIPWEIMHDGTDFLGLRFQVARLPIVSGGPDVNDNQPHQVSHIYNLLGENVLAYPGEAPLFDEWRDTFTGLIKATVQEHRYPSANGVGGDWPALDEIVKAKDADILHITCHGGLKDKQLQLYWTLNHQSQWPERHHIYSESVEILDYLRVTKPLVFGNACASAPHAAVGPGEGGLTPGLGAAFFSQGALAFVGTFAPITKRVAIGFARQFYCRLLDDGLPIGKAVWAAKKHHQDQNENDPSWLFYCLYGLPETRFQSA